MNTERWCVVVAFLAALAAANTGSNGNYSYAEELILDQQRGPSRWGDILDSSGSAAYPDCKFGSLQSPIDISLDHLSSTEVSQELHVVDAILEGYGEAQTRFSSHNDGAQAWFDDFGTPQTFIDPLHRDELTLSRMMLHSTSDHSFGGARRDLEIHLVYESSSRTTIVAVTAVAGVYNFNHELGRLFQLVPDAPAALLTSVSQAVQLDEGFDLRKLLSGSRSLATYIGSLTYPPCAQEVRYYVMLEPIGLSKTQLDVLRTRMNFQQGTAAQALFHFGNARPIQTVQPTMFYSGNNVNQEAVIVPFAEQESESQARDVSIASIVLSVLAVIVCIRAVFVLRSQIVSPAEKSDSSAKYVKS